MITRKYVHFHYRFLMAYGGTISTVVFDKMELKPNYSISTHSAFITFASGIKDEQNRESSPRLSYRVLPPQEIPLRTETCLLAPLPSPSLSLLRSLHAKALQVCTIHLRVSQYVH